MVVSITEDDEPGVTVSESELTIDEGGSDTYTVVLDSEPTAEVKVAIAGHADTDITLSGDTLADDTLTFTAENWNTAQTVTVTAGQDDDAVNEEEATLTHTANGGDYNAVTADVVVTITDNDTAGVTIPETALTIEEGGSGTYTVVLDSEPTADVKVAIAGHADTDITLSGDTLTDDALTFTAENWNTAQTVTVAAKEDDDAAPDAAVTLTHTVTGTGEYADVTADSVTVTIDETDKAGVTISESALSIEEGANATYTVVLDTEPTGDVEVAIAGHADTDITLSGDTLTDNTLTFTADDWNVAQTVTVTAAEDDNAVNENEATLTHTATGGDYDAVTADVVVTITDNDTADVTISKTALTIDEGATATYTVVLDTKPTADVTVAIAGHADTDITLTGDTLTDDTLTFTADDWDTAQTVTVTAAEDDDAVDEEEATLTHTVTGTGEYAGVTADSVTVNITDNDTADVTISKTALTIEEGASDTYTVVLDTEPTADVTVSIAGHADTDITLSGDTLADDTLTFTSDNWDTAQTVTVTAGEDDDAVNGGRGHADPHRHWYCRVRRGHRQQRDGQHHRQRHGGRDGLQDCPDHRRGRQRHIHGSAGHGAVG